MSLSIFNAMRAAQAKKFGRMAPKAFRAIDAEAEAQRITQALLKRKRKAEKRKADAAKREASNNGQ